MSSPISGPALIWLTAVAVSPFGALIVPSVSVSPELTVIVATNDDSSGSTASVDVPVPGSTSTEETPALANVTSENVPLSL